MSTELDLAGQVVELVRRLAGPGTEAEVVAERGELALTRFANSAIHQNVSSVTTAVRLRLHREGRTAAGGSTVVTGDGLRALVERTIAASRLCPPDPAWPGLTAPTSIPDAADWDAATAHAGPDERAARVRAFVHAAGGLEAAGFCRTTHRVGAFANTAGQTATGRAAEAAMDGIARAGGVDGMARLAADRLADLDGATLGARAAAKARAGTDPVELPPAAYQVVLEPEAVADLLQNFSTWGFNGRSYIERRSFAALGAAQFDPKVTLVDDPLAGPEWPFDTEGTARRRLVLVDEGVTRAVTHDRRTASTAKAESTGHATGDSATSGPVPHHLCLLPAGPPDAAAVEPTPGPAAPTDPDTAALVAGMERGLLVTDLWYTRVLDPKSLVITGLTRNGVWLVEDGVVTRAVRDLRFTQSYPRALAPGAVLGTGRRAVRQPARWDTVRWSAPALHLAAWNFTGGASG
ncbi:metallopeptidase TldD-related protein [Micromonospora sp. CPCC 206060]|uniref:TldD/PmbA family protein n=1 Tax=Micromonospora sp. CPCC 206060 TaxID=3122406 RepID=UPI002FEF265E